MTKDVNRHKSNINILLQAFKTKYWNNIFVFHVVSISRPLWQGPTLKQLSMLITIDSNNAVTYVAINFGQPRGGKEKESSLVNPQ